MTNSANKMIGKSIERRNFQSKSERKSRSSPKVQSATYINSLVTPVRGGYHTDDHNTLRLSPNGSSIHFGSPRTSPGLLLGHFAGGKWSEPPLPTELPKPPQQWTQFMFASKCSSGRNAKQTSDVTKHLKMLLNVQA